MEDYEKLYKDVLAKAREIHRNENEKRSDMEWLFPELQESEDERIRKALIRFHKSTIDIDGIKEDRIVAWLEKQESVREVVERCKNSWYNEGKIAGMAEGLTNDEKYQQGWHDALEKQGEQKPVDKVEPFDKYEGLTDFERTLADICIGWIGEELGWKQYIKDNADVLLKIAIKKFNSIQDAPFKQKSAWSEEDDAYKELYFK